MRATEFEVGILNAAGLAAFLVVGLPAGAWVDRWLKRRTMIAADLVRMAAMAAVPLLWWAGSLQIWHLYVISAVVGVATVFFDVSYQSFVPLLVAPGKVGEANSKLEATAQLARIGGPAAGGALLTVLTAPLLFIGESLGYLLSAVFLGRTRDGEKRLPAAGRNSLGAEIREGLAFVAAHPLMRRIVLCTGGGNFAGTLVFTLLPVLVLRDLGLGPQGMGIIMSVGAAGGLLGAVAAPLDRPADRRGDGHSGGRPGQLALPGPGSRCCASGGPCRVAGAPDCFRIRLRLRCARVQHHAAHHAPAGVPAAAARQDECVHQVRRLGSDAARGAGRRLPWGRTGPCASHVAWRGVEPARPWRPVLFSPFPGMRKLPDSVATGSS